MSEEEKKETRGRKRKVDSPEQKERTFKVWSPADFEIGAIHVIDEDKQNSYLTTFRQAKRKIKPDITLSFEKNEDGTLTGTVVEKTETKIERKYITKSGEEKVYRY
ncbi:MAG: hypothetical protein P4L31_07710 [Candidatus Babeliales bacterium]|nr:hypothetical protein [Candidatus Babeliales bacterium]